jgi:hypothetical protein
MRLARTSVGTLLVLLALALPAGAQSITFSVSPSSFTYPSADPDSSATVNSPQVTLRYRLTGWSGRSWAITVQAQTDLQSGASSIPAGNISWTASPAPLVGGTLSTTAQMLAQGTGNVSQIRYGYVTFTLQNLWSYASGTYSHTVVFTFSAL